MYIELNLPNIIDILSCSASFMLGLLFVVSVSENKRANIFLGLFMISLSIEIMMVLMEDIVPYELPFPVTSLFIMPFLLFYVLQTVNYHIKPLYLMLFVPGLLVNVGMYFFHVEEGLIILEYLFNIGILAVILKMVQNLKRKVDNYYSDLENKTLQWIRIIVFIYLGFYLFWITEDIIGINHEDLTIYFSSISTIATFFMILWIGHNGFSQHELFKSRLFLPQLALEEEEILIPSSDEELELYQSICEKIKEQRLYIDPKLNLRALSAALNLNEKELSRIINQQSGFNFYRFINEFRVNEFKRLLNSSKADQFSLLGLAEEAGFSSKSTFYASFKAIEGITPKQYENTLK
ncbi:AraC family transcriptional regulator [Puteibacter caeruleilacunae]|nr:AraC family transcriptional regulator [Puteibacter caeruleilacunae]